VEHGLEIPRSLSLPTPENFSIVSPGIYRSACPTRKDHAFLAHMGIKSIVYFLPGEYPAENANFIVDRKISLFHFPTKSNREHRKMPLDIVGNAVKRLMDPKNQPILVHCRQGKHRTGTVVGCLRKVQKWHLDEILREYHHFAGDKPRAFDKQYIEHFSVEDL